MQPGAPRAKPRRPHGLALGVSVTARGGRLCDSAAPIPNSLVGAVLFPAVLAALAQLPGCAIQTTEVHVKTARGGYSPSPSSSWPYRSGQQIMFVPGAA